MTVGNKSKPQRFQKEETQAMQIVKKKLMKHLRKLWQQRDRLINGR